MKEIEAIFLPDVHNSDIERISGRLDLLVKHPIAIAPWKEFPYTPNVSFSIGHTDHCLVIKYHVLESVVKASYYKPNDPVYKDSCVEFFVALDDEDEYYNFEWNVTGTCLCSFGANRQNRKWISEDLISKIKYSVNIKNNTGGDGKTVIQWELALIIPFETFSEHTITSLRKRQCWANFYKCGDDLPVPHFVTWNNIETASPDFHRREFFGKVKFS